MNKTSIRSLYIAPKGFTLVSLDLAQAESWVVAYLADERNMKHSLHFGDIHTDTAGNALYFYNVNCQHEWVKKPDKEFICSKCNSVITKPMRYLGKKQNHANSYRMGAVRGAETVNAESDKPPYVTVSIDEFRELQDRWHKYYYLRGWWSRIEEQLHINRTLITVYRFKRTFYQQWGDELFKEATAFEPQSTVAQHFNGAIQPELGIAGGLIEVYRQLIKPYRQDGHKIVNQAHDSCILEVPSSSAVDIANEAASLLYRPLQINGEQFSIPVDGEIGDRWGELVEMKLEYKNV